MARGGGTVKNPKIKGSNPATGTKKEEKRK